MGRIHRYSRIQLYPEGQDVCLDDDVKALEQLNDRLEAKLKAIGALCEDSKITMAWIDNTYKILKILGGQVEEHPMKQFCQRCVYNGGCDCHPPGACRSGEMWSGSGEPPVVSDIQKQVQAWIEVDGSK